MSSAFAPVPVKAPPPLYSVISAGAAHTCGVTPDGDAYCWGDNLAGQVGTGAVSVQREGASPGGEALKSDCSIASRGVLNLATRQADIQLAHDVAPFLSGAQTRQEFVERPLMFGREFEPGEKVEGFTEIAAMMQTPRDAGQILQADRCVARAFLVDGAALVLRQAPPLGTLANRDQRGAGGGRPTRAAVARRLTAGLPERWCSAGGS